MVRVAGTIKADGETIAMVTLQAGGQPEFV